MIIEIRKKMDIDTEKWSRLFDTTGMRASDVRRDVRQWAGAVLLDEAEALGVLIPNEEVTEPPE